MAPACRGYQWKIPAGGVIVVGIRREICKKFVHFQGVVIIKSTRNLGGLTHVLMGGEVCQTLRKKRRFPGDKSKKTSSYIIIVTVTKEIIKTAVSALTFSYLNISSCFG